MDVAEMLTELNDHGFEDVSTTRKVGVINDTLWDICAREPWPFLETSSASLTLDGEGKVTSPTDINKVLALVDTNTGITLRPERDDFFIQSKPKELTKSGNPVLYYFRAGQLYVWPIPSTVNLTLRYLKVHPELTDSSLESAILLPARHHRVLVLGALVKLYSMEDDPELADIFDAQFEKRLQLMRDDLHRFQYDRPDRIYVVDYDDYMDYYY